MANVKPFRGLRPPKEIVEELACLPYDVMNSEEAAQMANGKEKSLLRITRAEIECPGVEDIHSETVYKKAQENFEKFQEKGWLVQEEEAKYYIYAQTMNGRTQYGIVGGASCADYEKGLIKKHELTRPEKEEDRMVLTRYLNANIEPVFFAYKAVPEIDAIVEEVVKENEPDYNFTAEDGFGHHFWVINDAEKNKAIQQLFETKVPCTYVADGHHRTAAAARIGLEKTAQNPNHTGDEEYNYFMSVHFPDNQLQIIDYNRVVTDLNGYSEDDFLAELGKAFDVEKVGTEIFKPSRLHEFSLYLGGNWYKLTARKGTFNDNDPIGVLDVTILSNQVLEPLLGIADLRTSKRIDFVGGIRGLGELKKRVDSGEMKAAFALYPVSMKQLIDIADSGNIMPPKTTWFEPKLRSGLVIHKLD
ncbi:Uncharacterized conserved protein, DUF1015 family [Mariniphaga anaerophila]|uniref:Uncharacterized conserved protein, DUF1015 family n=1 Tax=Mariniphaga anaerophila TaxID=1484053 RepID=A0A1M4TGN2_9BACT|nr:DUF1015 family protein [Mariniphaga anaerophila]SHE43568.1 Uncharacterized conserved protein, DUF1015 family [Mariniphaga anaerophila]